MDEVHRERENPGPLPSERFASALTALKRLGIGADGEAVLAAMMQPATGQEVLGRTKFGRALAFMENVVAVAKERPELLTEDGRRHLFDSLVALGKEVADAYRRGRTLAGDKVAWPESPVLADAMEEMDRAFIAYGRSTGEDGVERLMRLIQLRAQIARAAQTLRSHDPKFAAQGPELGALQPSPLANGVQEQSIRVSTQGRVTEPLARNLPGVGLEKYVLSPDELVEKLTARGTVPPGLAEEIGRLLWGYHRAHLIGPGFGTELYEGLMLAPADVNLTVQNEGVERFIRSLAAGGAEVHVAAKADGRRLVVTLGDGETESVDVLKSVDYRITVAVFDRERVFSVRIDIADPPSGQPSVTHDLPDATGPEILEALRTAADPTD